MTFAALEADTAGVDRFLAERAEALALERLHPPAHFPAGEELLQTVVHGASQAHPAQDLFALVGGERGGDGLAMEPAVAGIEHLGPGLFEAADGRHTGRGLVEPLGPGHGVIEAAGELAAERRTQGLEADAIASLQLAAAGGLEDLEGESDQGGVLLGHEGAEA